VHCGVKERRTDTIKAENSLGHATVTIIPLLLQNIVRSCPVMSSNAPGQNRHLAPVENHAPNDISGQM
jgi:hypothetical protein